MPAYHKEDKYKGDTRKEWHPYDRRSGTGRGTEMKKGGAGRGNWGTDADELRPEGELKPGEDVPEKPFHKRRREE